MNNSLKLILIKALLVIVMPFSFAQQVDINNKPLNGKVKSIFEKEYSAQFDIVGNVYRVGKNNLCKYYYDSLGNMNKYEFLLYNELVSWYWIQTYNEKKQPLEKIVYQRDNVFMSKQVFFYHNDKLVYWLLYDQYKKFSYGWYLTYDKKGNVVQIEARNQDSLVSVNYNYVQKKSGKFLEITEIMSSEYQRTINKKVYNKKNQLISEIIQTQMSTDKFTFDYDDLGRLIQQKNLHYSDSTETDLVSLKDVRYKYDAQNNVIESTFSDDDELYQTIKYEYQYDSLNNWIYKAEYKDEKPVRVTDRVIEYY